MDDFSDLASSLAAGIADVRGCLILSRDGLVLGSHPSDAERQITPAWVRFASMGDPERGFAQFGSETWCYLRRGPYAAFAVVGVGARPGLVIDHMEQVLLTAEEARARRDAVRAPEPAAAPTSKPRATLHPEPRADDVRVVIESPTSVARAGSTVGPEPTAGAHEAGVPELEGPSEASPDAPSEQEDVDRFSLAREFGRLLQHGDEGADG